MSAERGAERGGGEGPAGRAYQPFQLDAGEQRWTVLEADGGDVGLGVAPITQHTQASVLVGHIGGGGKGACGPTLDLGHAHRRYARGAGFAGQLDIRSPFGNT